MRLKPDPAQVAIVAKLCQLQRFHTDEEAFLRAINFINRSHDVIDKYYPDYPDEGQTQVPPTRSPESR